MALYPKIQTFISDLDIKTLAPERKKILASLCIYLRAKVEEGKEIRLHFLCTHNSRRSHFAQIWAQTMAAYYQIHGVHCYSAGSEETSVFPMVIEGMKEIGFLTIQLSKGTNPIYYVKYSDAEEPILSFSKNVDHPFNPKDSFATVMTCGEAEDSCPNVPGAEQRISIHYEDPKAYDETQEMAAKYEERSRQIATEMKYVFSKIK